MTFHQLADNQSVPAIAATAVGIANAAGSGAGSAVTTAVSFKDQWSQPLLPASLNYAVVVTPSQACFASVTNKTPSGFNVVLTPVTSATTLAAGSFDAVVHS
jgi:hypothetical protein